MINFFTEHGEEAPNVPVGLNPISDAAEAPTLFQPDLTTKVVFEDIGEGASFEDSFGWYNVGDDVQTAAGQIKNLHVVLGVNVAMVNQPFNANDNTVHYGDPNEYVENAEETSPGTGPGLASVDFNEEKTAGRYKGGFISFYMITPENSPADDNNGDFTVTTGSNPRSKFGHIYFTDKDLNNDGDFVHYLVYVSKAKQKSFIFGFEDLFRGGDNDFEDMLVRVTGLTPPCVPTAEICDGIDNDCDGKIDESPTDVGSACLCDSAADCDDGPLQGACENGLTVCTAGKITCHSSTQPSQELCDGIDNNCNGVIDDNPTNVGSACGPAAVGTCEPGHTVCSNGAITCTGGTGPTTEICDGLDNDCDGKVDEGNPGGGGACGTAVGVCTQGTLTCENGSLQCVGGNTGSAEICNGLDDNCDGVIDNNPSGVGSACGSNSTGACKLGQTICENGSLQCAGIVGPSPEICDGIDNDCDGVVDDNPIDAGQPCGSATGACQPGKTVCVNGALQCQGATGPTAEICNGIDDDCDGIVDEDVPGVGSSCNPFGSGAIGSGSGSNCTVGMEECIAGAMQCVGGGGGSGVEICNGIDDDCDGKIDEGSDLCGSNGACIDGACAAMCVAGEFPCPQGQKCNASNFCVTDPCFNVNCPPDMDGNSQSCNGSNGMCQPICDSVTCTAPLTCRPKDGECVPDTCDYLPLCGSGQLCINSQCGPDPCSGVSCPSGEFCRSGSCVQSCQGVECPGTATCADGVCVATGCSEACPTGTVCNGSAGICVSSECDIVCPLTQVCDPISASCVPNQCYGVVCPGNQTCSNGQCGTATHGDLVTAAGGAGCDAGGGNAGGFAVLALIVIGLVVRRRQLALHATARRLLLPALAATSLATAGCHLDNYCIDCTADNGDGGVNGDGGNGDGGNHGDGGNNGDGGSNCGGANLQTDPRNCGFCGNVCQKPGAETACGSGQCEITGCFPGFYDLDGDTSGPYAQSDGCEYECFVSNGGVEVCDGLDNDCDGKIDEGIDKNTDPNNCGQCGRVCDFFEATGHCSGGVCSFNPATDCDPGYSDADGMQQDGCEYQCTPTNGGVEKCDLIDNDCDGKVDEGFNTQTDPQNCGRCGNVCSFPHTSTDECTAGTCSFNPATDCAPGFVDANHEQLDGCEYQCTPSNGGVEICDGKDNDCDGIVDENPTDAGGACAATNPPKGACQANGTLTCSKGKLVCTGETDPSPEICNNIDDNCDGLVDNGVTRNCYDGPSGTNNVGVCKGGTETCTAGVFSTTCAGEVKPSPEICDGLDNDCNGKIDDGPNGSAITQSCYGGPAGTANVGQCKSGTQTCSFGAFGGCIGEVDPSHEVCGDGIDNDCNGKNDSAEGCLSEDPEQRLTAAGGSLGDSPGSNHEHDVVVAVGGNPYGTHVYTAWNALIGGTTQIYFRSSLDGGKTWGTIVNVSASSTPAVEPVLAVQPSGTAGGSDTLVVAYQQVNSGLRDILVQSSTNNGSTWSSPTASLDGSPDSFHQVIAISGSTVVVTWEQLNTSTLNRDVVSKTSTNSGSSFGSAMTINASATNTTRFAGRPQVGITSSGGVVWAWREQRTGQTRDVYGAFTTSATTAPSGDIRIDNDTSDTRDSDFPQLVVTGLAAYLVWQDPSTLANGGSNISFSRSTNGGKTWSTQVTIDDPGGEVSASFSPTIAVDPKTAASQTDDVVGIAWQDQREGTQVFTSVSTNGAASFPAAIRASSVSSTPVPGVVTVPSLASAGSGVFVVSWQEVDSGENAHVFVASSIDSGVSWSVSEAQLDGGVGAADNPQTAGVLFNGTKPGGVVAWTDFRANNIDGDIYAAATHN